MASNRSQAAFRQIQARAEASQAAIAHQLADAISRIAHTSINALAAIGSTAKANFDAEDAPAPASKSKKRP